MIPIVLESLPEFLLEEKELREPDRPNKKRERRENQPPTATVADVRGGPVAASND